MKHYNTSMKHSCLKETQRAIKIIPLNPSLEKWGVGGFERYFRDNTSMKNTSFMVCYHGRVNVL